MSKVELIPGVYSVPIGIDTKSIIANALSYTAPYSQVNTPLGAAMFLQMGCTDANSRAYGWDTNLKASLNQLSSGSTMGIDGVAGYQTWTAIYALFDVYNPHLFIS